MAIVEKLELQTSYSHLTMTNHDNEACMYMSSDHFLTKAYDLFLVFPPFAFRFLSLGSK